MALPVPLEPVDSVGLVEVLLETLALLEVEPKFWVVGRGVNVVMADKPPLRGSLRMRRTVLCSVGTSPWTGEPLDSVSVGERRGVVELLMLELRWGRLADDDVEEEVVSPKSPPKLFWLSPRSDHTAFIGPGVGSNVGEAMPSSFSYIPNPLLVKPFVFGNVNSPILLLDPFICGKVKMLLSWLRLAIRLLLIFDTLVYEVNAELLLGGL